MKLKMSSSEPVDVVVFGVGDLRTDDHGGLVQALSNNGGNNNNNNNVLPIVVLESFSNNIPGSTAHPLDTATLLHHALLDLHESLETNYQLQLQVVSSYDDVKKMAANPRIHVCDLGPADNAMGYGAYSYFHNRDVQVHAWTCRLREEPWQTPQHVSDDHPTYASQHAQNEPQPPLPRPPPKQDTTPNGTTKSSSSFSSSSSSSLPSPQELVNLISQSTTNNKEQRNTGLYGTHWGGLDPSTVGELKVLELVQKYVKECNENDKAWLQQQHVSPPLRNPSSLEHAAMEWGSEHWIKGEPMTRFLAAPLFLGTISPRRLWHLAREDKNNNYYFWEETTSVLRTLVESKEWHALLAARNIHTDPQYSTTTTTTTRSSSSSNDGELQYKYWRWHGFLCRYAQYGSPQKKEGMLLIHGFGASGSQWTGTMEHLGDEHFILAPDLIGFGHSEKPPLTYTQYLWESYTASFHKEVAHHWESFIVGGNSIGGYTSMGVAADDAVPADESHVSASGSAGSGKCAGVILMNSAGQIKSRREVLVEGGDGGGGVTTTTTTTIAQITSGDALPRCSPPLPRSAARAFGHGLLWYLRPRIQDICKNLYPTNPSAVNENLVRSILRDSLDPGAINVMISGSKLPPPRTANELLGADYGSASTNPKEGRWMGPVLVAQGMLDPLNDAKTRATMLGDLREGITVTPIDAGHCPHDELPKDVANAIDAWMQAMKIGQEVKSVDDSAQVEV
jgi:pimeloyl-ACP methyl ester carboxylesterase